MVRLISAILCCLALLGAVDCTKLDFDFGAGNIRANRTLAKRQVEKPNGLPWHSQVREYSPWNLITLTWGGYWARTPPKGIPGKNDIYKSENNSGAGVDIYFFTYTLIPKEDPDFTGRMSYFPDPGQIPEEGNTDWKCMIRCTMSLAAGNAVGIAKKANTIQVYAPYIYDLLIPKGNGAVNQRENQTRAQIQLAATLNQITNDHRMKADFSPMYPDGFKGPIVNLGFAYEPLSIPPQLIRALKRANSHGVLVIGPAGADGVELGSEDNSKRRFPCQLPGVICVGGMNRTFGIGVRYDEPGSQLQSPDTSNTGTAVSLWAPAINILCPFIDWMTALPLSTQVYVNGSKYLNSSSISWATAQVSGIAAIMLPYLDAIDDTTRHDTLLLRRYLLGNALRGLIKFPRDSMHTRTSNRDLFATTGINSLTRSDMPFSNGSELYKNMLNGEERSLTVESLEEHRDKRVKLTSMEPELHCFETQDYGKRILKSNAENLHLRLLLEIGHVNLYLSDVHYDKPIPCYEESCVYLYGREYVRSRIIEDSQILEKYVNHIVTNCALKENFEGDREDYRDEDFDDDGKLVKIGGYMRMKEYSKCTISVQRIRDDDHPDVL